MGGRVNWSHCERAAMRSKCAHTRARRVGVAAWCRDCGAFRDESQVRPRWVVPGRRGVAAAVEHAPHVDRQLRLVGVDDVACFECIGAECGFCSGSGVVPAELGEALRFAKGGSQ